MNASRALQVVRDILLLCRHLRTRGLKDLPMQPLELPEREAIAALLLDLDRRMRKVESERRRG